MLGVPSQIQPREASKNRESDNYYKMASTDKVLGEYLRQTQWIISLLVIAPNESLFQIPRATFQISFVGYV